MKFQSNDVSLKVGSFTINFFNHSIVDEANNTDLMQPKFIEVLYYLAQRYPNLVTREELIDNIWQGNRYVGEKALTNAVWNIRQKLHQDEKEYIQTVRKSGYRLLQEPSFFTPESSRNGKQSFWPVNVDIKNLTWAGIFLAVISAIYFYFSFTLSKEPFFTITSISASSGRKVFPSISPDGQKLVYYWKQFNKDPNLYLKDLSQPDLPPTQLTFDSKRESRPVWNKSGDKIYFAQKTWNRDQCNIVELDLKTKSQKILTTCKPNVNAAISISNKGNILAVNSFDPVNTSPGIYFIDIESDTPKPYRFSCAKKCDYSDRDAIFSPDDNKLAITRRSQQFEEDIFLVDIATGETKRLTYGQRDIHGMAWHPRTNKLIYSAEFADKRQGFVIDMDSYNITNLNISGFSFPSLNINSTDVYFHNWQNQKYIATLDLSDNNVSAPFPLIQSEFSYYSPTFNSKNSKIAYLSNKSGSKEIWIADKDGTQNFQLTNLKKNIFYPQWSHDGERLAFLIRETASDKSSLHIINVKTKVISKIKADMFTAFGMPTWMQNDTALLVEAIGLKENAFYAIDINGESHKKLIKSNGGYAVHTKDNEIWFSSDAKDVSYYDLDSPELGVIRAIPKNTLTSEFSWLKDHNGIYFQQRFIDHIRINYFDLTKQETFTKIKIPLRTIENHLPFAIIPEHPTLLMTQSMFSDVGIEKLRHSLLND